MWPNGVKPAKIYLITLVISGYPHGGSMSMSEIHPGFGTAHRTKSISGHVIGSACLPGLMSGSANLNGSGSSGGGGMSTASFIHSVSNQIEEIQRRKLPEPPPSDGAALSVISSIKEEDVDDVEEEEEEVGGGGGYVGIEKSDSGRGTLVSRIRKGRSRGKTKD